MNVSFTTIDIKSCYVGIKFVDKTKYGCIAIPINRQQTELISEEDKGHTNGFQIKTMWINVSRGTTDGENKTKERWNYVRV